MKYIELLYNPAILFLDIYLKEFRTYVHTKTYTHMFIAAILNNSLNVEATQMSINWWMKKGNILCHKKSVSPLKRTEVLMHAITWVNCANVMSEFAQSCPTLCDPMDCSLPGSSIHGIFQAIVLEWIAISFSRGSSQPRDRTQVSCIVDRHFTVWATREVLHSHAGEYG